MGRYQIQTNNSGSWFLPFLTLLFITLKLCGVIHWSWWWVLSPILIPLAILIVLLIVRAILIEIAKQQ